MGFVEFCILVAVVVFIAFVFTWAIGYFAPNAPDIIVKVIWGVAVFIVLITLFTAVFGGKDVKIPHV